MKAAEKSPVRWLKVEQAAREFDVSKATIYREIKAGHIPAYRKPGSQRGYRVTDDDMRRWFGNWEMVEGAYYAAR